MPDKRRVFVLGLDGATLDLIAPWVAEGRLPNFAKVLRGGASGSLESTVQPNTPTAWSSFMTGTNPGKHGVFNFRARRPDSYEVRPVNGADCSGDSLWSLASINGLRVASINMPMTYPPEPVNGIVVSGWDAPGRDYGLTYPEFLIDELERRHGPYILDTQFDKIGLGQFEEWFDELDRMIDQRSAIVEDIFHQEDWDLFGVVYVCLDRVQHVLWRLIDPQHPYYDAIEAGKYGDRILRYHQKMDTLLGRILDWLKGEGALVIVSDHGFGPIYYGLRINKLLADIGLFRLLPNAAGQAADGAAGTSAVDWPNTKAYSFGYHGQIYINLEGREPQGTVQPGRPRNELCDFIVRELESLEDPYIGGRLITQIFRREDVYSGPFVSEAADILFQTRDMLYRVMDGWSYVDDATAGVISPLPKVQNGAHRMNGTFAMHGSWIKSGCEPAGARIIDVAPTILHYLGAPVPEYMDGRVLEEIIDPEFLAANPVRRSGSTTYQAAPSDNPYSEEEMDQINRRLKSLGYIL